MPVTTTASQPSRPRRRKRTKERPTALQLPAVDRQAVLAAAEAGAKLPPPPPPAVLNLAERMLLAVRQRRAQQLAAGLIDQAAHDRDVAAAGELLRLAQDVVIFGDAAPLH